MSIRGASWTELNIDLRGRESGILKTSCPSCSPTASNPNKTDLSVDIDTGVFRCWNDGNGCGFQGKVGLVTRSKSSREYAERAFARPDPERYSKSLEPLPPEALLYMQDRGISAATLARCHVGWGNAWRDPKSGEVVQAYRFPYTNAGELINVKSRSIKKDFRLYPKAELIPWRIDHRAKTTLWVEGELDALSLVEVGFDNVLSVPNGGTSSAAPNLDYLDACAAEVSEIEHHILCTDDDETGRGLFQELVRRFGKDHCSYVVYPDGCKDANDVLRQWGPDALRDLIERAVPFPIDEITRPIDTLVDLEIWKRDGMPLGLSTGLKNLDACWTVVPGELTLISGIPGHGKSGAVDQVVLNLAELHQWRSLVFSPEYNPVARHMIGLCERRTGKVYDETMAKRWRAQRLRCEVMTVDEMREAVAWINDYVSFIERHESMPLDRILELARIEVARRGIKVLVVDPWNEIEHEIARGLTETLYISQALTRIKAFAQEYGVHVFLVAHPTKMQATVEKYSEEDDDGREVQKQRLVYPVPSAYSISGGAHWRNKADNVLIVWRDTHARAHGRNPYLTEVHVDKVRWKYDGAEGMAPLIYDPPSGRLRDAREHELEGQPAPLAPVSVGGAEDAPDEVEF
jgi:twinkle protein